MSLAASPLPAQNRLQALPAAKPFLTWTFLAILCAIFAFEVFRPVGGGRQFIPSLETVVAYGALVRDLVFERGEWYRLLTGPLLHGSILHILMNGLALWSIGPGLERKLGRTWLFVLFFLGAIGGALGSLSLNPPELASIGASGAIMCLIAADFVILFRSPQANRWEVQWEMIRAVGLSLVPLFYGAHSGIDGAAHLGGAVIGLLLGGLLWLGWEGEGPAPRWRVPARLLAILGVFLFASAIDRAVMRHDVYARTDGLIPESEWLSNRDAYVAMRAILNYPEDPRSHWLQAQNLMTSNPDRAVQELKIALSKREVLETRLLPEFTRQLNIDLVRALIAAERFQDAWLVADPICRGEQNLPYLLRQEICAAH